VTGFTLEAFEFVLSILIGIRRGLPRGRPGVCGLRIRIGVDSTLIGEVSC